MPCLKTGDPFTARIRCRKLSNAFEHLIDKARTMPDLSEDRIKKLIRTYFQRCLDNSEEIASFALDDGAEVEGNEAVKEMARIAGLQKLRPASRERVEMAWGMV